MTNYCTKPKKINLIRLVAFLFNVLFLSSCVSLKQSQQEQALKVLDLKAFDGTYVNLFRDKSDSEFATLWNQLDLSGKPDTLDFKKATIGLKAIGKNEIRAVWICDDMEKKRIVLNGKLKGNYFVSGQKRTVIPIPLIYGQIRNRQFQLWLDKDSNLRTERLENRWGWVFLFFANNDQTSSYKYKKSN